LKNEANVLVSKLGQLFGFQGFDSNIGDGQISLICGIERAQDVQQGTFASAGSADYTDNFTALDVNMYAFEYFKGAV
jgi:hypothetical protein